MPFNTPSGTGGNLQVSAVASAAATLTLSADGLTSTVELTTLTLPRLYFWFQQTTPAALSPATARMQYAVRAAAGVAGLNWLDFEPQFLLVPGQATIYRRFMPAVKIRARIARVAGTATTVDYVLGASAT